MNNLKVVHDQQHQMFFVKLSGGAAYLKYDKLRNEVIDIKETHVPESAQKNGVGSQLVKRAIEYSIFQNMPFVPTCHFAEHFLEKHPEYKQYQYSQKVS